MSFEQRLQLMLDSYGLENIMIQNDIEELRILELLEEAGLIDVEDYFYTDMEEIDDED